MRKLNPNDKVLMMCVGVFAGMVGLTYASVPLYRAFCQATGYDGTPQLFSAPSDTISDKTIEVRFDANVGQGLPWEFRGEKVSTTVKLGATNVDFYRVRNMGDLPITGQAAFNVTPLRAAKYFHKVKCFCENSQKLGPLQSARFGVSYYVKPEIATDPDTKDIRAVTLSYTFFPAKSETKTAALSRAVN